jgi:copper chaperone
MSTTSTYTVEGMTCDHCVRSVTSELTSLDGVSDVQVELHPENVSVVTVTSQAPLRPEAVTAAIDEAGYALIDPTDPTTGSDT